MKHTYTLTGMTCSSCEQKVKNALLPIENILNVSPSNESDSIEIEMEDHVPIETLRKALLPLGDKYMLNPQNHSELAMQVNSWFNTYKPILLIFAYILSVTLAIEWLSGSFSMERWMPHFMAGFFLGFSFFKLLNLKGFAESYAMYDVVARRLPKWGYLYAFIELFLGFAYLYGLNPIVTNLVALIVMSVSIIGVLKTVLDKKQIKCACLGDVFNLPMSTVTIIEDALMILMSGYMLTLLLL